MHNDEVHLTALNPKGTVLLVRPNLRKNATSRSSYKKIFGTVGTVIIVFVAFIASNIKAIAETAYKKRQVSKVPESRRPDVIPFPTESSVGTFIFRTDTGLTKKMPARGRISVKDPRGTKLIVDYQTGLNMSPLRAIPPDALEELDLAKLEISSDQLTNIKHLTGLCVLHLSETDVDDSALDFLSSMQSLKTLDLRSTCITSKGVATLAKHPLLSDLNLSNNNIGDAGASALRTLKNLRKLRLAQCRITDKGVNALASIESLRFLNLERNPGITDKSISYLTQLRHLSFLNLANTSFTALSIEYLVKMRALKVLIFSHNNIKPAELEQMQKKLPMCKLLSDTEFRSVDMDLFQPLH